MADYDTIEFVVEDDVATLRFDRPEKKNAMNRTLLAETGDAIASVADEVHALVVTGNGDAFNAGMDFDEYFEGARAEGPLAVREANRIHGDALSALKDFPHPTIAKVNGWALGGGYLVMALCDLAFAAEDARFGLSEINFGIAPGGGAMWATANTLDRRDALYYSYTGEPFTGAEAAQKGAINEAVPAEDLDERVREVVEVLLEKDRFALEYSKAYYERVKDMSFEAAHDYELAKGEEMKYFQGYEFLEEGVGQFVADRYRPGAGETYDKPSTDEE